ncbi:MAG: hypothetical protein ACRC8W_04580 [Plesiomonas shigelloides]
MQTLNDAYNHIADMLDLDMDGAQWVYENSNCPLFHEEGFADYDFLGDECVNMIPAEFVNA